VSFTLKGAAIRHIVDSHEELLDRIYACIVSGHGQRVKDVVQEVWNGVYDKGDRAKKNRYEEYAKDSDEEVERKCPHAFSASHRVFRRGNGKQH